MDYFSGGIPGTLWPVQINKLQHTALAGRHSAVLCALFKVTSIRDTPQLHGDAINDRMPWGKTLIAPGLGAERAGPGGIHQLGKS
jgi:hypothetical protein